MADSAELEQLVPDQDLPSAALLEIMASYIPSMVVRRLALAPSPPQAPLVECLPGVVLFADISGFTALAERLAQRGPSGAEALSRTLNAYFGQMIDLIAAHGGDVIKFAGDALLTLWPVEPPAKGKRKKAQAEAALQEAAQRAAQCGLAMQTALDEYGRTAGQAVRLSMRIGVGAGEVMAMHTGGVQGRWEFVVAGSPLTQMSLAINQAQPGQVVLSPEAWALVQEHCTGSSLPLPAYAGAHTKAAVRLDAIPDPLPPSPVPQPKLVPGLEAALNAYLPPAVQARLAAGQAGWLAELRRLTVLFVNLPAVPSALELAQMVMAELQRILYRYEGSIRQFIVDDKGATLIGVLGLPPLAHEDDAARGVQVAMEMSAELRRLGLRGAIGVTTGRAFCGMVGNERRREYAVVGDVVNLSARLMQAASRRTEKKRLLVLCDEATYQAARARIEFEALPKIPVKGKAEPQAVFCPLERKKISLQSRTTLVGRTNERVMLADALLALLTAASRRDGEGRWPDNSLVILEGEAGIGKSCLVQELYRLAEAFRVTTLYGVGDAIEQSTPYFAWREVFDQMLNLEGGVTLPVPLPEARQLYVREWLAKVDPGLVQWAPLLNEALSVNFPDSPSTASLDGPARVEQTRAVLLRLLQASASRSPKLIILEDAQWMDAAAWELAALASREVHPLLLAIATRPLDTVHQLAAYRQLLETPGACHVHLRELTVRETLEVVCQRLGVERLSEPLVNLVQKAEGHPFFAEEMARALRDSGLLQVAGDECRLASGAGDWRAIELPHTIQGAITGRLDRLPPAEQLTLKAASVIGRVFNAQLLDAIYPIERDKPNLPRYLYHLERIELIARLSPEHEHDEPLASDYVFKSALTCDVVYNLLPDAQRQQLHAAIAHWYEQTQPGTVYHGLLVHHWTQAGDIPHALDYLEKVGREALHDGNYQEAAHFFNQALELDEQAAQDGHSVPALRRARWERLLGEAYWQTGNVTGCFVHVRHALELLGQLDPTTRTGKALDLLRQALVQALHRVRPGRFLGRRQADEPLLELGRVCHRLGVIHYSNNQLLQSLACTLRGLNALESTSPESEELSQAYASFCLGLGVSPLQRLADVYRHLAQATAAAEASLPARGTLFGLLAMYDMGLGRWDQAQAALERASWIYDILGNLRSLGECLTNSALAFYYHGEFARLEALGTQVHEMGNNNAIVQVQAWGLALQAMHAVQQGQLDRAMAVLESGWDLITRHNLERVAAILNRGLLVVALLRQGKLRAAGEVGGTVSRLIGQGRPMFVATFDGYVAMAQLALAVWEAEAQEPGADVGGLRSKAQQACQVLHAYARVFPIGRPRAWLYQGWYNWLAGGPRRARWAWRKSVSLARQLDMPYEEALVYYEIGRHAARAERYQHLSLASDIFTQLGASCDLTRAQVELGR